MKLFEKDTKKPGRRVLLLSGIIFVVTFIVFFFTPEMDSDQAIINLISIPLFLMVLILIGVFTIFFWGLVSGTPSMSITYVLAKPKFYWRGILGGILMVAIVVAFLSLGPGSLLEP